MYGFATRQDQFENNRSGFPERFVALNHSP